ncbi:unnamed protein product [Arctia plantaginis]|uniref:C2H2-type domain-containing protein n=1 Tax=Arctia plantaginis TaxID=874455 RepID=A0A8S1A8F0_ARCPL|nr:unnamed protein product [Arctia plantaginis]
MDVKVECERISILCHGCLTADRRLRLIDGETRQMFYELRDGTNFVKQRCELLLCWECVAFLQKLKVFQARIKTAQCLLMQYLQCYYKNEKMHYPDSLSLLNRIHRNTYNFEFYEEEKNKDDIPNGVEVNKEKKKEDNLPNHVISKHKENKKDLTPEDLLPSIEIKTEYNDSIKEEYNCSNDNDSDYYEGVLQFEQEESGENSSHIKKNSHTKYKNKKYNTFAEVTKRTDVTKTNYMQFSEPVSLDKREYEKILIRDKERYGYSRMPFKCEDCRIGYFKRMDLQRHNSSCHSHKFPYKCAACPTEMTSLEHQDQHWADLHSTVYKCTLCSEVHQSSFEVKKHIKLAHTKNYTCRTCSQEYGSLRDFKNHYKTMHEKIVCDYCNNDFTKKRSLISHMK